MSAVPEIIVVGAGVLGLCTAAELARRGHAVTVIDPGWPNASSIAAGMIAPALEAVLDAATPELAQLLKDARDLWPEFAAATGVALIREGAEWRGPGAAEVAATLQRLGFEARLEGDRVLTADDWRVDAAVALAALAAAPGVARIHDHVQAVSGSADGWTATLTHGQTLTAPVLVLATGAAAAPAGLPPPSAGLIGAIQPIRGQAAFAPGLSAERVVRGRGGYVVPAVGGAIIGATMEFGVRERDWDQTTAGPMLDAGLGLIGRCVDRPPLAPRVGIRGASPDGLPMAGPSGAAGLHLALAPRRNGWLLGPLVARTVADAVEGAAPGPHAAVLDPRRFL